MLRSPSISLEHLLYLLRQNEPPIIARIGGGEVLIDTRTLLDGDDEAICRALAHIAESNS